MSSALNWLREVFGRPQKPVAPSSLVATPLSGRRRRLSWRDNAADETGFKLRATFNGGPAQYQVLPANTTSLITEALPPGTYRLDVCATNAAGDSDFSNLVTVSVLADPPAPSPVPPAPPPPASPPASPPPAPAPQPAPVPAPSPATGEWSVEIVIGSRVLMFRQREAVDLGVLRTASAAQRNQVRYLDHPLHVLFRPEADGWRMEIVFELGRLFAGDTPARCSYAYTIRQGTTIVAFGSIANHMWQARWRWQSAPRGFVPARLEAAYAAGLLPGRVRNVGKPLPPSSFSVMGTAGLLPYMPNTGGRPDIGLITDWCGQYLARGDNLSTILAQAEASGSMPWHFRDERTGRLIDLAQYPAATTYPDSGGSPTIPVLTPTAGEATLDTAHMPNMLLVPYLLTEDPYYLEAMQAQALWMYMSHPANQYRDVPGQTRALAWELRQHALAYVLTPADPGWLTSRDAFAARLAGWRQVIEAWMARPGVLAITVDKTEGGKPITAPWEDDFLTAVLGWCVRMGLAGFEAAYAWRLASTLARADGKAFPRNFCTSYRYVVAATWPQVLAASSAMWPPATNPPTYQGQDDGRNYLQILGGTLALAKDRPGCAAAAAWVNGEMERQAAANRGFNWSFQ